MSKKILIALAALATAMAYTVPAGAAGQPGSDTDPGHDYVMVTLSSPATASYEGDIPGLKRTKPVDGKLDQNSPAFAAYQDHLSAERADFINELRRKAPNAEVIRTYSLVLNGVALKLNGHSLADVSRVSGISNVGFSSLYEPDMNVSVELIGADDVWDDFDLGGQANAGAGISVGVIDTGIQEDHHFFDCKDEIVHEVFVSGEGTELFGPDLFFDHGTHVAGTVAGCVIDTEDAPPVELDPGVISGVAPGATLHDYNVFPGYGAGFIAFGGSAFSHDIAAALEEAVDDGMDIVNMSLGGGVEGPHDFLAEASNATVDAGTVVVSSAGNSGPGDATVGSPAVAEKVIAVAAMTNGHFGGVPVTVGTGDDAVEYVAAAGDFGPYGEEVGPHDIVWWDDATTDDDTEACDAADDESVIAGNIALIERGTCSFTTKIRNAENAGANAVVVYNNVSGSPIGMAHDGTDPKPEIVAVMVSDEDGAAIIDTQLGEPMTIAGTAVEFEAEANHIAEFSSRGPAPFTNIIKPDITAPGVNVYSSVFDGQFAFFQGTSMSSPHIAGAAALLLDANPGWMPIDVKSALVNTAERKPFEHDGNGIELLARGGGIAWLPNAIDSPATLDPVNASFGLWEGNKAVRDRIVITIEPSDACSSATVIQSDGPVTGIVSATLSGGTLTVDLDGGKANTTSSGDYAGDIELDCGDETLRAPWFVRIDRKANP